MTSVVYARVDAGIRSFIQKLDELPQCVNLGRVSYLISKDLSGAEISTVAYVRW